MNFIHSKFLNTLLIFVKVSHQVKFLFLHLIPYFGFLRTIISLKKEFNGQHNLGVWNAD